MVADRKDKLKAFVAWAKQHITGDEKGQARIFLDRLFQAFGQKGSLDVGGTAEFRVRKAAEDGGGVNFADYVWKPIVLIEMKKREADLAKHRPQMFDYWTRSPPGWPEFAVYAFSTHLECTRLLRRSSLIMRKFTVAY